jgi:hypothetical protein
VGLAQPTTQVAPPDFKVSPDGYKVVAQTDQYRVIEGTWKPGQRDEFHSHPKAFYYWTTDCSLRSYLPDGTTQDFVVMAGRAGEQYAIPSHSLQNVGKSECRVVMFEPSVPD